MAREITLQPAHPVSPSSIVAAVGAAYLIYEHTGVYPTIRWQGRSRHGVGAERPVIGGHDLSAADLAELIAEDDPIDRSRLPGGGRGQSLARLIEAEHPDTSPSSARSRVLAHLHQVGAIHEMHLVLACVLPDWWRPERRLMRSCLSIGAKSDVAAAVGRGRRRLAAGKALEEISDPLTWHWGEQIGGDWGLCPEVSWGTYPDTDTPTKAMSRTLARLLMRGVLAAGNPDAGYGRVGRASDGVLLWPTWETPISWTTVAAWSSAWSRFLEAGSDGDDPLLAPSPDIIWLGSQLRPRSKMIPVWTQGGIISDAPHWPEKVREFARLWLAGESKERPNER